MKQFQLRLCCLPEYNALAYLCPKSFVNNCDQMVSFFFLDYSLLNEFFSTQTRSTKKVRHICRTKTHKCSTEPPVRTRRPCPLADDFRSKVLQRCSQVSLAIRWATGNKPFLVSKSCSCLQTHKCLNWVWVGVGPFQTIFGPKKVKSPGGRRARARARAGNTKGGEAPLYHWPPVGLVWNQLCVPIDSLCFFICERG